VDLVVDGGNLRVARGAVERDRLRQRGVGVEPDASAPPRRRLTVSTIAASIL